MDAKSFRARARKWCRKELRPLLIMALVVFSIRSSFADWNDVPTGSMKPTIIEGDRIFVNKLAYDLKVPFTTFHLLEWSNPKAGEIVVFDSPKGGTPICQRDRRRRQACGDGHAFDCQRDAVVRSRDGSPRPVFHARRQPRQ